jgi:hypothetical protein
LSNKATGRWGHPLVIKYSLFADQGLEMRDTPYFRKYEGDFVENIHLLNLSIWGLAIVIKYFFFPFFVESSFNF